MGASCVLRACLGLFGLVGSFVMPVVLIWCWPVSGLGGFFNLVWGWYNIVCRWSCLSVLDVLRCGRRDLLVFWVVLSCLLVGLLCGWWF